MKSMQPTRVLVALLGAALCLAGCGGSDNNGTSAASMAATSGSNSGSGSTTGSGSTMGSGSAKGSGSTTAAASCSATVAAGAPNIAAQPADQTIVPGQHALFHVVATGATTYQWCQNGSAISGATSSTYYSGALAATDAGASFTVVVGNASGSTVSNAAMVHVNPNSDGSPPASFWGNTAALPKAAQVMTFSFVNATNGKYPDSQIYWSIQGQTSAATGKTPINEVHSIAAAPTFDMPDAASARMYFFVAPASATPPFPQNNTSYYDFIEFNIGPTTTAGVWNFNGDTTRVDAFGLKTAIHLHCTDSAGSDFQRGEDYGTFLEDRTITFLKYQAETPTQFAGTVQYAPYRITEPGNSGFKTGGPEATYYDSYIDEVWANNNIDVTKVPKPSPFLNFVSNQQPDLSAAMERHVAQTAGTFNPDGTLVNKAFWSTIPSSAFYAAPPANYYAQYWHTHGIAGKAYGFPYDDVGGYSSDISCNSPQYLVVAIGW